MDRLQYFAWNSSFEWDLIPLQLESLRLLKIKSNSTLSLLSVMFYPFHVLDHQKAGISVEDPSQFPCFIILSSFADSTEHSFWPLFSSYISTQIDLPGWQSKVFPVPPTVNLAAITEFESNIFHRSGGGYLVPHYRTTCLAEHKFFSVEILRIALWYSLPVLSRRLLRRCGNFWDVRLTLYGGTYCSMFSVPSPL